MECDYLVVGAGLFGSVLAERIANDLGGHVVVIDQRDHIGGNCYSKSDPQTGIEYHPYGTHIFHASSQEVWDYLQPFAEFNNYYHQVLTTYKNQVYQMPINLETINAFYRQNFRPAQARAFLEKTIKAERIKSPRNLEEKAISMIGRPLYEAFIKGYTIKQWGKDPRDLPPEIINRLPVRFNYHESYFHDSKWQGLPIKGYTAFFEKMLHSPKIQVRLKCDFFKHRREFRVRKKIIYSGPIDRYFDHQYGELEWRAVSCERKLIREDDFQGTAVMNFADPEIPYNRIHEPKHLHPERDYGRGKTIIFYEYSLKRWMKEGFYPINTAKNEGIVKRYKALARKDKKLIVGGRLGDYAYYDMDKVILRALSCYRDEIK